MSKLSLKDYRSCAPDPGSTIRVNHKDCPAGTDTRRRLYLTVNSGTPDFMLGYCHNCQQGGSIKLYSGRSIVIDPARLPESEPTPPEKICLPSGCVPYVEYEYWPLDARAFIHKDCSFKGNEALKPLYNPHNHSIVYQIYDEIYFDTGDIKRNNYRGYIERALSNGPKYIKNIQKDIPCITDIYDGDYKEEYPIPLVICEDLISAACVATAYHKGVGISIYGVHITPEVLYSKLYEWQEAHGSDQDIKVVVWLDNDSDYIKEQAERIRRYAELMGYKSCLIEGHSDPKHYAQSEIREIIDEVL